MEYVSPDNVFIGELYGYKRHWLFPDIVVRVTSMIIIADNIQFAKIKMGAFCLKYKQDKRFKMLDSFDYTVVPAIY